MEKKENLEILADEIEKIKKNTDRYYWPAMELGYKCWAAGNQNMAETEKLKFKKEYFLAYENVN